MADGVPSTSLPVGGSISEFIGHEDTGGGNNTVRVPFANVAAQVSELIATNSEALWLPTWTALAAITGTKVGQPAQVIGDNPIATHTDPVVGGAVLNNGVYGWSASPVGWQRLGDNSVTNLAPLASPVFTGNPTAPTPPAGDSDTSLATTAFVAPTIEATQRVVGADVSALSSVVYGDVSPNSTTAVNTNIWGLIDQNQHSGFLTSASIRVASSGAGMFLIVGSDGTILSEHSRTVASGVNSFTFADAKMPEGARLFWRPTSGADLRYQTGGAVALFTAAGYPGAGARVSVSLFANVLLAMEFTVKSVLGGDISTSTYGASSRVNDIASKHEIEARAGQSSTFTWSVGAPSISRKAVALDVGTDIPAGTVITGIYDEILAPSGTDRLLAQIFSRDTASGSIETAPILAGDVLLRSARITASEAGLTVGASTIALATIPVEPFIAESGKTYFAVLTAFDATGMQVNLGNGGVACTESRQRRRGYYATTGSYTSVASGFMLALGLRIQRQKQAAIKGETPFERFDEALFSYSGLTLTSNAIVDRNGRSFGIGESRTLTAAAAGLIRYDTIYFDTVARAFGIAAGGEHATDAPEMLATLSSSRFRPVCNVRVNDTEITDVVETWRINRFKEPYDLVAELDAERRRSRSCIRKTLGKARRGAAIKIVSIGDSITAIESTTTGGGLTTPNGSNRDRGVSYLGVNLSSAVTNTLPLFTSVQLGRADDGAGSVHTKWGMIWDLVAALEDGGSMVTYDNFSWGGKASADAMSGGAAGTWVTNVIALSPDLVIIHFGMNELGNTSTENNLVVIATALRAAGIEVIMMGVERRNNQSEASLLLAEYTNRAISNAALHTDSGHVPTWAFFDERYLGAVGISKLDTSTGNAINHPGIVEQAAIGRELVKIFL
jgi:hypothetical protein